MEKIKAVLLDRDGTINQDFGYVFKTRDLVFLPGAIEGLKLLSEEYKLFIITNQSGIGRGFFSERDFHYFMGYMNQILKSNGINIEKYYFCPHHPQKGINAYKKDCNCRKPKEGLFLQAIKENNIDITNSWSIGDSLRDIIAAQRAGLKTIRIETEKTKNLEELIQVPKVKNLYEVAQIILKNDPE